jgi:membrane-associated phospholipid phosphatase
MLLRPRNGLIAAAAGVGLLVLTWALAFHVAAFRDADQSIFRGFYHLSYHGGLARVAGFVARLCNPNPYVYLAAVPMLVALVRRRLRLAVAVGTILLGANVTTQLLKPLLAEPRAASLLGGVSPVAPASWPSGHATAAMSLALGTVLAVPARVRPAVAALGAAFAVAVSYSFLTLGWHYPSDVFGGFLVAATWTLLAIAALRSRDAVGQAARPAVEDRRLSIGAVLTPPIGAVALVALLTGLLAVARPHEVVAYARGHGAFMVGAAAIGAVALALATALVLALRR